MSSSSSVMSKEGIVQTGTLAKVLNSKRIKLGDMYLITDFNRVFDVALTAGLTESEKTIKTSIAKPLYSIVMREKDESKLSAKSMAIIKSIVSKDGSSIGITGDSISYNHNSIDPIARTSAEKCHVGMRSWSFMLRDIIHKQDLWFKHLDELPVSRTGGSSIVTYNGASAPQILPFGGRVTTVRGLPVETPIFSFEYKHQGEGNIAYLLYVGDPTGLSTNFTATVDSLNPISATTKLTTANLQGRGIVQLPLVVPNDGQYHTVRIYNFVQVATTPDPSGETQMTLIGMSSKKTDVDITGVGGFDVNQLLTQWPARAVNHAPDVLFILIGANDSYHGIGTIAYKAGLQKMIDDVRVEKPDCEFVLMTSPGSQPDTIYSVDDGITLQYVNAMREISELNRCHFMDLFDFFSLTKRDNFQFDQVHLNRQGNTALCEHVASLCGFDFTSEDTDTYHSLVNFAEYRHPKIAGITAMGSPDVNRKYSMASKIGATGVIRQAVQTGDTVRVDFNYYTRHLGVITVSKSTFDTESMEPLLLSVGDDYIEFKIVRADGLTLIQEADYPTQYTNLNFHVNYTGVDS